MSAVSSPRRFSSRNCCRRMFLAMVIRYPFTVAILSVLPVVQARRNVSAVMSSALLRSPVR